MEDVKVQSYIGAKVPLVGEGIRLAVWQGENPAGTTSAVDYNIALLEKVACFAKEHGAQLLSLPELYSTGYAVSRDAVRELSVPINGMLIKKVGDIAKKNRLSIVLPYAEVGTVGGEKRYYDSICLLSENGEVLKNYRKTHLWGPDEKKFWTAGYQYEEEGEAYTVHNVNGVPVGLLNCYEAEFPEINRILALRGAKLIVIPTAADKWVLLSDGRKTEPAYPDVSRNIIPVHAMQNSCFIAYCNRCGVETVDGKESGEYLGNSVVVDPHGSVLVAAFPRKTLLLADCVPSEYGGIHPENTHYFDDRRKDLYHPLLQ